MTRNRIITVLLVTLLMMSTVSVGVTGTVAAQDKQDDCEQTYDLLERPCYISAGIYDAILGHDSPPTETTIDNQADAYYDASNLEDEMSADYTRANNSAELSRTMAYRIAESTFAEELANGSTKATAQKQAEIAVTQFLASEIENRIVYRNNNYVTRIADAANQSGVGLQSDMGGTSYPIGSDTRMRNHTIFSSSPTGGYNITVAQIYHGDAGGYSSGWAGIFTSESGTNTMSNLKWTFDSSQYDDFTADVPNLNGLYSDYVSVRDEVVNEISTFANNINESQYENLNASDITSPLTKATEWGQSYNDTGSTGYAAALAASAGYSTSNLSTTYHVKMLESSDTYTGTIYSADGGFSSTNGEVRTGVTYDGANMSAWIIPESGGGSVALNGDFEVQDIQLQGGSSVNATEMSSYSYETLNASEPLRTYQQYQELLDQTEELEDDGGLGVDIGSGDGTVVMVLMVLGGMFLLGLGGAVIVAMSRSGSSNSGGFQGGRY